MGRRLVLTLVAVLVVLAAGCEPAGLPGNRDAANLDELVTTLSEAAEPDITPTDDPDPGFDWWGRDQAIVFGFLAFGLLVLVIAGSLGFLGFTRKLEKEGRRVRSGRWPRR